MVTDARLLCVLRTTASTEAAVMLTALDWQCVPAPAVHLEIDVKTTDVQVSV